VASHRHAVLATSSIWFGFLIYTQHTGWRKTELFNLVVFIIYTTHKTNGIHITCMQFRCLKSICSRNNIAKNIILLFSERELLAFTFAICCRPSVCLAVCLSGTLVHRTQPVENFRNFSAPFDTLAIRRHPPKILPRSFQGNPSVVEVKHKRGSQI